MKPSRPVFTPSMGIPHTAARFPWFIMEPSPPTVIMQTQPSPLSADSAPLSLPETPSSYFSESTA